jgi:hypothetical protein
MDTIWTGLLAGAAAAAVTLLTQFFTRRHQMNLLNRELEHQARAALRQTYGELLIAQRRSREASLQLAAAPRTIGDDDSSARDALTTAAIAAHSEFLERYHRLNLDASRTMWIEARGLRDVLDAMLKAAKEGEAIEVEQLGKAARHARQNLEGSFRLRLGYERLQGRKPLPEPFDKGVTKRRANQAAEPGQAERRDHPVTHPGPYEEMRGVWTDHNRRQEFEHDLLNRKTTWLLTTQAILFAAYGVTFGSNSTGVGLETFRVVVAYLGLTIAAIILVGVSALVNSKRMSWRAYREFFEQSATVDPPRPLDRRPLEWGVRTGNTVMTLLPDVLLPLAFIVAWGLVILQGA